jgi:uncharacterized protein (TIGR04222 family)
MVSDHEVTPSEQVDEVWHLHLVYTRSYWDELCPKVLGRPLHHHPTRGGLTESTRHHEQYDRTLASYRLQFGESAPTDIWPPAEIRFGEDLDHVRTSHSRNWIIPKPRLWHEPRRPARWLLTTALVPLMVGVANPFEMQGPEFLALYGILTAMVIAVAIILRRWLRTDELWTDSNHLAPHEVACLGRGAAGVLQSCLAGLVADGRMAVVETPAKKLGPLTLGTATYKLRAAVPAESASSEIERVMLNAAKSSVGTEVVDILKSARPIADEIESKLQSRGLLETDDSFSPARWWPILLLSGLAALGVIKLIVGLSRDKPILFLAIWLIALGVVAFFFARKPLRTIRGDQMLKELKDKYVNLKSKDFALSSGFSAADMMLVAALFGLASVEHPQVRLLQSALKPISPSDGGLAGLSGGCSGGCAGGGGCGGGGCGGGCGGCGGGD